MSVELRLAIHNSRVSASVCMHVANIQTYKRYLNKNAF